MTKSELLHNDASLYGIEKRTHTFTVMQMQRGLLLHDLLRCALLAQGSTDSIGMQRDGSLLVQQRDGRHLALEITERYAVALVHDAASARSPLNNGGRSAYSLLVREVPRARMRTIERLAVGLHPPAASEPWATAVLWSEADLLCTPGSWSSFLAHGGWMIEPLLMEPRSALRGYQRAHHLRDGLVTALTSLFERRTQAQPEQWIVLERSEFDILLYAGRRNFTAANEILLNLKIHAPYRAS